MDENERLKIRRYDFGIIFQTHYLFKGFSALENIELASVLSGQDLDEKILKRLGIDTLLHQKIGKLSGGQQQRVSIARVLCKKPKIIFADEATGNLDFDNAKNVIELLISYVKENDAALFFVTHDSKLASFCDKIYTINVNGIC
ncbi:ABC transporter family protein [Campylobacter jejuni subsp. jejuni 305]|nr:putative ABC transporter ATP binding protein [Campylobacter jejuni subsp. jejuni CG8486]EFV08430.1 ABC transporter family protein [Campylobacter jejuni subsp. jejuni 305]